MLTGWSARAAMEQRSQGFGYDGARRTPQVAGISSGSQPRGKDTGVSWSLSHTLEACVCFVGVLPGV